MSTLTRQYTATETLQGFYIKTQDDLFFLSTDYDMDAINPHKEFGVVKFITIRNRSFTGDVVCKNIDDLNDYITQRIKIDADFLIRPLYLLDHSGVSIRTAPFHDTWDSGTIGYALCTKQNVIDRYGTDENWKQNAVEIIEDEVNQYDCYLKGAVYRVTLYKYDPDTRQWDVYKVCGGFYTDDEESIAEEFFDMSKCKIITKDDSCQGCDS